MRNCPDITILNTLVGQGQIGDFLHRIILLLSVVKEDLTKKEKIGEQFDWKFQLVEACMSGVVAIDIVGSGAIIGWDASLPFN